MLKNRAIHRQWQSRCFSFSNFGLIFLNNNRDFYNKQHQEHVTIYGLEFPKS